MNGQDDKTSEKDMKQQPSGFWDGAEVISVYTRAQAIDDGVLVDVSEMAKEQGFRFPVAVTARVWADLVDPTEGDKARGQSADGRMWDVLTMLRHGCRTSSGDQLRFSVIVAQGGRQRTFELTATIGPGDSPAPVITVQMPDED